MSDALDRLEVAVDRAVEQLPQPTRGADGGDGQWGVHVVGVGHGQRDDLADADGGLLFGRLLDEREPPPKRDEPPPDLEAPSSVEP